MRSEASIAHWTCRRGWRKRVSVAITWTWTREMGSLVFRGLVAKATEKAGEE